MVSRSSLVKWVTITLAGVPLLYLYIKNRRKISYLVLGYHKFDQQIAFDQSTNKLPPAHLEIYNFPLPIPRRALSTFRSIIREVMIDGIVGLDAEWKPSDSSNLLATIQVSSINHAVIFQINGVSSLPQELVDILVNEECIKLGTGIIADCQKIHRDFNVICNGVLELKQIITNLNIPVKKFGLQALCSDFLGYPLDKSLQLSDWSVPILSEEQVRYAAVDAWVSLALKNQFLQFADRSLDDDQLSILIPLCTHEITFPGSTPKQKDPSSVAKSNKQQNQQVNKSIPARKKALYESCEMYSPTGKLLCTCSAKRVEWYANRGLGTIINENPLSIRLHFEPENIREHADNASRKENKCVICGSEDNCLRHHVVPHVYRRHFPSDYRLYLSHDIVLVCSACHPTCVKSIEILNDQICGEMGITQGLGRDKGSGGERFIPQPQETYKIKGAAAALLRHRTSLPETKRVEYEEMLRNWKQLDASTDLTDDILQSIEKECSATANPDFKPYDVIVWEWMQSQQNTDEIIGQFIRRWRKHFLDSMNPRFLPSFWDVNHRVSCKEV